MSVNDRGETRPTYEEAFAQLTGEERQSFLGAMDAFRSRTGESLSSAKIQEILDSIPGSQAAIGKHARLVFGIKDDVEAAQVKEVIDGLLRNDELEKRDGQGPGPEPIGSEPQGRRPAERVEEGEVVE